MIGIVLIQGLFNLIFLTALVILYRLRSQAANATAGNADALRSLEARAAQLEVEIRRYEERARDQIRGLAQITEEATRILKKAQTPSSGFSPSVEECELKAALTVDGGGFRLAEEGASASIPTLNQIEKTRQRLKSDMTLDLRTLLKDQLA